MTARGLTLIELLIALVLLAALVSAGGVWLGAVAHTGAHIDDLRNEPAILNVLTRIQEDLIIGDFEPDQERSRQVPQVRIIDGSLEIDLRSGTTHVYTLEQQLDGRRLLVRMTRTRDSIRKRVLLHDILELACEIDHSGRWLDISIVAVPLKKDSSSAGRERFFERRLRVP